MQLKAGYKFTLFLAVLIAAVVLCTLPFLLLKRDCIHIYTQSPRPSSRELGFIRELKRLDLKVVVNSKNLPTKDSYGVWFKDPDYAAQIAKSPAKINFLYTEAYYPLDGQSYRSSLVILTPYRALYEHYMRSNIKSAMLTLGVNLSDFYKETAEQKKYPIVYYGDNDNSSPLISLLQNNKEVWFLGSFWTNGARHIMLKENSPEERRKILASSEIVVIYTSDLSKISEKVMEAVASGALVFYPANSIMETLYKGNLITYQDSKDCLEKIAYYLQNRNELIKKAATAQKITIAETNSATAAKRFLQILTWLKQTQN